METVCRGKRWEVLLSEHDGRVAGAMPYLCGRKLGLRYVLQPQLTMFTGPWVADGGDRAAVMADLAQRFAALRPALCCIKCAPSITDVSAFTAAGLKAEPKPTYRFQHLLPLGELMAGASQLRRRDYARNSGLLSVDTSLAPGEFAAFHKACFEAGGGRDLVGRDLVELVCRTAIERGQGLLLGARDASGTLQAAAFAPYDSRCAYLLMLAHAPTAPRNAMTFAVWKLAEALLGRTEAFDFEGGSEEGVARFYASFGAERVQCWQLTSSQLPLVGKYILR